MADKTLTALTATTTLTDTDLVYVNDGGNSRKITWANVKASITLAISSITSLQASLDAKAPTANPVFTGTVTIPDNALAIADTSGLQTALNTKAPTANPVFTGTVTIPDGALAIADTSGLQTALDSKHAVVLADDQETASFTFALTHAQKITRCNHATVAITATVPTNATVAFPLGTVLHVNQWGVAAVTVAATGGVTINKAASKTLVLAERYAVVSLWKQATDTWLLFGHLTDV